MTTRYTITPRLQHRDVLLQRDGGETITLSHEGLPMIALEDRARRIAVMLDGRTEAVCEAARDLDAYERRADRVPGGVGVRRARLAAAIRDLDALDGGEGRDG